MKYIKSIISIILYCISTVLTLMSYILSEYKYGGEGYNSPQIVSDAVIAIIPFTVVSSILALIAMILTKKKRLSFVIFCLLLLLNAYRFSQVIVL